MRLPSTGLWRNQHFLRLWLGQAISKFGSQIGGAAIPLTAILLLEATPLQVGLLAAAGSAAVLLVGLPAGVWVDRLRRRPILVAADLGRALLLGSIPLAALLGLLRIEQLYVVAALVGVLTIFFDVAYQAFLPVVVDRADLVEGNSKLGVSDSVAEIAGPPLSGVLVQVFGAPLAVLLNALSFLGSALALGSIRTVEPALAPAPERQRLLRDIAVGLREVVSNRLLRPLVGSGVTLGLAGGVIGTLYYLYTIRELGLSPALVGLAIGVGGAGALVGALFAARVARRYGIGPTLVGALLVATFAQTLILFAPAQSALGVALVLLSQVADVAFAIYFINEISLRQAVTPDRLMGRANASLHVLTAGAALVGALGGGMLAQILGLRSALAVGVAVLLLSALWLIASPVRGLRRLPAAPAVPPTEAGGAAAHISST